MPARPLRATIDSNVVFEGLTWQGGASGRVRDPIVGGTDEQGRAGNEELNMSQVTLDIPETLFRLLEAQARREGVLLDRYLVEALARQASAVYTVQSIPESAIAEQRTQYAALLQSLGRASYEEIERTLAERELAEPDSGLTPEVVSRLRERLARAG